jgi:hypothetical protein
LDFWIGGDNNHIDDKSPINTTALDFLYTIYNKISFLFDIQYSVFDIQYYKFFHQHYRHLHLHIDHPYGNGN